VQDPSICTPRLHKTPSQSPFLFFQVILGHIWKSFCCLGKSHYVSIKMFQVLLVCIQRKQSQITPNLDRSPSDICRWSQNYRSCNYHTTTFNLINHIKISLQTLSIANSTLEHITLDLLLLFSWKLLLFCVILLTCFSAWSLCLYPYPQSPTKYTAMIFQFHLNVTSASNSTVFTYYSPLWGRMPWQNDYLSPKKRQLKMR
jgi:hypothetical protein